METAEVAGEGLMRSNSTHCIHHITTSSWWPGGTQCKLVTYNSALKTIKHQQATILFSASALVGI